MCFAFILVSQLARHLQLRLIHKQLETVVSHYNTYIDLVLNGNGAGALSCATISGSAVSSITRWCSALCSALLSGLFSGFFIATVLNFPLSRHPIDFQMFFFFFLFLFFPHIVIFHSIPFSLAFLCLGEFLFGDFPFLVLEFDCVPGAKRSNVHIFRLFIFFLFGGIPNLKWYGLLSFQSSPNFLVFHSWRIREKEINSTTLFSLRNCGPLLFSEEEEEEKEDNNKKWDKERKISFEMVVII